MSKNILMKHIRPLTICSLPILFAVAACDSTTLGPDEEVNITISTDSGTTDADFSGDTAPVAEARALLAGLEADGGTPYDVNNALVYPEEFNIFIPSVTGVDLNLVSDENPSGPTARIPMFRGLDPNGNSVDYIITESSDREVAELMGIIYAPRQSAPRGSAGTQSVTLENGIMQFEGSVDFSPTRFVTAGDPNVPGTPNEITRSSFPPADMSPGAIADSAWSSYVILPSGQVLNAQLVANATGIHDRIPDSG